MSQRQVTGGKLCWDYFREGDRGWGAMKCSGKLPTGDLFGTRGVRGCVGREGKNPKKQWEKGRQKFQKNSESNFDGL